VKLIPAPIAPTMLIRATQDKPLARRAVLGNQADAFERDVRHEIGRLATAGGATMRFSLARKAALRRPWRPA
jgi:hypothetical protein